MARLKTLFNNVSVTAKNLNTNNHCVNTNQLMNGKKFNFNINGINYVLASKTVMEYIAAHPKCHIFKRNEIFNEETCEFRSYISNFYLINDNFIVTHYESFKRI